MLLRGYFSGTFCANIRIVTMPGRPGGIVGRVEPQWPRDRAATGDGAENLPRFDLSVVGLAGLGWQRAARSTLQTKQKTSPGLIAGGGGGEVTGSARDGVTPLSSSLEQCCPAARRVGISPARVFSARSLTAATLLRESPAARSSSSGASATFSAPGQRLDPKLAQTRP